MHNLGVCSVLACVTADLQQTATLTPHIPVQDTLGADLLFFFIFKRKSTEGFCTHDSCIETQTLVQPLRWLHAKIKNRQTAGHIRAVLAFVITQYLPKRYSHFFSSELHFNDLGGSKFYHVACYEGRNGYAKTSIHVVDPIQRAR